MNLVIEERYIETTKSMRKIRVLLPDDYEKSDKHYGVIYMHDGQNLFRDQDAYASISWGIYESKKHVMDIYGYDDMIVVGIDNSPLRLNEYSPWKNTFKLSSFEKDDIGGLGHIYAQFIVEDLIPFIEYKYRVIRDKYHRFVAGSSMGAYISQYMISTYPDVFIGAGIFSLASWFNEGDFLSYVKQSPLDAMHMFFISIGKHESSSETIEDFNDIYLANSRRLKALLEEKGLKHIVYLETDDQHNEQAWRKLFPEFYHFIQKSRLTHVK